MKKVTIRLEEDTWRDLRQHCLDNDTSMQAVFEEHAKQITGGKKMNNTEKIEAQKARENIIKDLKLKRNKYGEWQATSGYKIFTFIPIDTREKLTAKEIAEELNETFGDDSYNEEIVENEIGAGFIEQYGNVIITYVDGLMPNIKDEEVQKTIDHLLEVE